MTESSTTMRVAREPDRSLFADVVGQEDAIEHLCNAARNPVHAYLFLGPSGAGPRRAAYGFAAALLCPHGGCGHCSTCERALAGIHPDVVVVERTGASLSVEEARRLIGLSQQKPFEASRQVLIVTDVHLASRAAPALLKTIEEPPASTVFVLLADDLPYSLSTVASRCVEVIFRPVSTPRMLEWLRDQGIDDHKSALVADMAAGDLERARLLASDPALVRRAEMWRNVPEELDGSGARIMSLVAALASSLDEGVAPLKASHERELAELALRAKEVGVRGVPGRKEVTDRHAREERRWRNDELRAGLAILARHYSSMLHRRVSDAGEIRLAEIDRALEAIGKAARALRHNPLERLLLESLLIGLDAVAA